MKKGALAASAVALGTAASSTTATAQDDGDVLVFSYDYFAGADFTVIAQLEQSSTVSVLQTEDEETVPEISQPDDYTGHVIRYDLGGTENAGVTTFLFSQDVSMSSGDSGTVGEEASMFSAQLNLLNTSLDGGGGGATETDDGDTNETEDLNETGDTNETEDLNETGDTNETEDT